MTTTKNIEHEKNQGRKVLNVPNLRFPEFQGEWEKKSLGEIGDSFIGLTYRPTDIVSEGGLIVFRSSNIQNGCMDYKDIVRVNKNVKEKLITKKDDLLVCARNGSARLIGKNAILHETDANQTFGAFMMVFRSDKNHFVHQLLNTRRYSSQVSENLGARINQITSSDLSSFEFFFPKENSEMNKISALLDLLDERIATQNKIIDKLQSLIKGINRNVFTDDGFNYMLKELCEIKSGYSGNQLTSKNGLKVSRIETISGHKVNIERVGYVAPFASSENYKLQIGDILFSNINSVEYIGNTAFIEKDYGLYHGMNLLRLMPNKNIVIPLYLYLLLNTNKMQNHFKTICNKAVSQASVNQTELGKTAVKIPSIKAQKQICELYQSLYNKLETENNAISLLQKQKEYLLRQMFI